MHRRLALFLALAALSCGGIPKIKFAHLQADRTEISGEVLRNGQAYLGSLMQQVRGARFGDRLFATSSRVYWLIPEIHKVDLYLTAQQEGLSRSEVERRLNNLQKLHADVFIFSIDLRMPLNPTWTKEALVQFLKDNLRLTLEVGDHRLQPKEVRYLTIERFQEEEVERLLSGDKNVEVSIPMRTTFAKSVNDTPVITRNTGRVTLKFQLMSPPPYNIGYFDERLFQGYMWTVSDD